MWASTLRNTFRQRVCVRYSLKFGAISVVDRCENGNYVSLYFFKVSLQIFFPLLLLAWSLTPFLLVRLVRVRFASLPPWWPTRCAHRCIAQDNMKYESNVFSRPVPLFFIFDFLFVKSCTLEERSAMIIFTSRFLYEDISSYWKKRTSSFDSILSKREIFPCKVQGASCMFHVHDTYTFGVQRDSGLCLIANRGG